MSNWNANIKTSIAVVFGFLILLLLPFEKIIEGFHLDEFTKRHVGDSLKNICIIAYGYLLIRRFGYIRVSGITSFVPRNSFLLIVPVYFLFIAPVQYTLLDYEFHDIHAAHVIILFCTMITVGASEEVIFRGFVLPNLIKGSPSNQSLLVPIVYASLLFGVLHFLNLLGPDMHFPLVLSQVIYATFFGIGFGIMLLRTGTLFPLGLFHGMINFSSNLDDLLGTTEPPQLEMYRMYEAIISVIIVVPFLIYMLKQISRIDKKAILDLYN